MTRAMTKGQTIQREHYLIWSYQRATGGHPRWRKSDQPMIERWAYSLRSDCGTYFDSSKSGNEFPTQEAAESAAQEAWQKSA